MVPDDVSKWGFANINDNATIVEQIACGARIVLFSTGAARWSAPRSPR
jgi:altronate dehydratase large subunit